MSFHIVMVKLSNNQCLFACEFMLLFIISLNVEIVTRIRILVINFNSIVRINVYEINVCQYENECKITFKDSFRINMKTKVKTK